MHFQRGYTCYVTLVTGSYTCYRKGMANFVTECVRCGEYHDYRVGCAKVGKTAGVVVGSKSVGRLLPALRKAVVGRCKECGQRLPSGSAGAVKMRAWRAAKRKE